MISALLGILNNCWKSVSKYISIGLDYSYFDPIQATVQVILDPFVLMGFKATTKSERAKIISRRISAINFKQMFWSPIYSFMRQQQYDLIYVEAEKRLCHFQPTAIQNSTSFYQ